MSEDDDLAAEILAALDRLEEVARAATPGPWTCYGDHLVWPSDQGPAANDPIAGCNPDHDAAAAHIALHDPAFVLAWCAGLRGVVALHGGRAPFYVDPCDAADAEGHTITCDTLRALARAVGVSLPEPTTPDPMMTQEERP